MARLNDIGSVNKVLRDAPTLNETGLVIVHERGDERLQTGGQGFGNYFGSSVLEGVRSEIIGASGHLLFGKENNVGTTHDSTCGSFVSGGDCKIIV